MGKKITPPLPFFLMNRNHPNSYPNIKEYNSPPNYIPVFKGIIYEQDHKQEIE